jgi:THO complex subunit 1
MAGRGVQGVGSFGELLAELMKRAEDVKHTSTVDPALNKVDLADLLDRLESTVDPSTNNSTSRRWSFAVIETAFRDQFNKLLVSSE